MAEPQLAGRASRQDQPETTHRRHELLAAHSGRGARPRAPDFLGFEDDAIFLDTTLDDLSRAVAELNGLDWDLFYLDGAAWEPPVEIRGHQALQRPRAMTCLHAVAVNHTAYDRFLADIPAADGIREWITTHVAIDQFLAKQVNAGRYRAYVLNPGWPRRSS